MKSIAVYLIGIHSNIGQMRSFKSASYAMTIIKTENLLEGQLVYEGLTKANLPSFCNLTQDCTNYENITMTVKIIKKNF